MFIKKLAVIAELDNGDCYQVCLDNNETAIVHNLLTQMQGSVKVLDRVLNLNLVEPSEIVKEEKKK